VNAPFRGLCFVALFDQVVDRRLLAYVLPSDTPGRCGGHCILPDSLPDSPHFFVGRSSWIRRLYWKGRPFHRRYRKRPRRLLNRPRPLRFLSYRRVAYRLRLSGLTSHSELPVSVQRTNNSRATQGISPGLSGGDPYEATLHTRNCLPSQSWTMRSVADAKWSATPNSSVASCYQPPSFWLTTIFHLGSVSSAVKFHWEGIV
jgi:hypothetical protein